MQLNTVILIPISSLKLERRKSTPEFQLPMKALELMLLRQSEYLIGPTELQKRGQKVIREAG